MEKGKLFEGENLEKFNIKLKSKPKDGVILQLHHTVRGTNGESHRIRFSTGTFDDSHDKLACTDNLGNIFILDFTDLKFWKLSSVGPCSALYFMPHKEDCLVTANTKKNNIIFIDVENGKVTLVLDGHTAPVKHISFSNSKTNNLLTASPVEAILWELQNYTKYFTLNTYLGAQIQQIMFNPTGDHLVACFQNDTVQIWKNETMQSVKQIIPSELKHMKTIAFTMNGRAMAMAGLAPTLILFSMDTWKAIKSIDLSKYNISGAQQIAFIPQVFDGGANKILAILGSDCTLHLLDLETLNNIHRISPESSGIKRVVVSPVGKYFLCILQLGEVNIYNASYVLEIARNCTNDAKQEHPSTSTTPKYIMPEKSNCCKNEIEQKMRTCMDSARLRRILMQYGEYPDKFRSMIWRSLLNTPRNKDAYAALIDKGIHPAYKDIEKRFTIHSALTLKSLKRLLSCLAHWCPLFGVMKFLPGFVFPFVKVLQKDPLLLFECVATILINYCQLWFEYAPFPPISVLAMVENILGEHDQNLLNHYCEMGITSQTYALKILETAFSEILTCPEWLILWDHILSNEPAFLLMAIVSYNVVQKNAVKRLKTYEQLENYFHLQNPVDKKIFLKKTYVFLNETSEEIHPKSFFNTFVSLQRGSCYQQFTGYPKATICMKLAKNSKKIIAPKTECTLKDLTKMSQESQINEMLNMEDEGRGEDASVHVKVHKKHDSSKKDDTETATPSYKQKSVNSDRKSIKKGKKDIYELYTVEKAKTKSIDRKNGSLDKKIKKLIDVYTKSNLSDTG